MLRWFCRTWGDGEWQITTPEANMKDTPGTQNGMKAKEKRKRIERHLKKKKKKSIKQCQLAKTSTLPLHHHMVSV